jgi:hypothetical protein
MGLRMNPRASDIVFGMNTMNRAFRLLSLVLIATLIIGLATPGRAEAIEPLTIVAIAGAAVLVVAVVIFLVIANMHDSQKKSVQGELRYLACVDSDVTPGNCWVISERPGPVAGLPTPSVVIAAAATQSP